MNINGEISEAENSDNELSVIIPPKYLVYQFAREYSVFLFPPLAESESQMATSCLPLWKNTLQKILSALYPVEKKHTSIVEAFDTKTNSLKNNLLEDALAIYQGDPAATSMNEVIVCYPGFFAILIYRVAHILERLRVPIIPRMLTEYAHSRTGIDIHPGAIIGKGFCIDHGTGVVIGETTHIGDFVKIYQGVTLGALSVSKCITGKKRHPTIGNGVTIYAGATILGGDTIIGEHSVIGGNTWITTSVPPHSTVLHKHEIQYRNKKTFYENQQHH